jgi:glycosyltransferase involved in cell wall biosynthesis
MEKLTSVVIPAFNAERFIERTLRSALRQTSNDLEIIVVDDGSTDRTKSIVQSLALSDERIRLVSVPNGGVALARNIGLEHARGEFVAFLDADDLWHPSKLEMQIAALNAAPDAAASYGMFRNIDELDRVTGNQNALGLSGYTLAHHLYVRPVGNGSSLLIRRKIVLELGGYDSSWAAQGIGGCEDFDFELKIVARYPIAFINQYLVGYRVYPGNMSSNYSRIARGLVRTVEQHAALNPVLPGWLVRKASASALEYAVSCFMRAHEPVRLISSLFRLLRADVTRGLKVSFVYIPLRFLRRLRKPASISSPQLYFDDLASDDGRTAYTPAARERKTLERIEHLDLRLAKTAGIIGRDVGKLTSPPKVVD